MDNNLPPIIYNNEYKTPKIPKTSNKPSKYTSIKPITQFSKPDIAKNINELVEYLDKKKQLIEGKSTHLFNNVTPKSPNTNKYEEGNNNNNNNEQNTSSIITTPSLSNTISTTTTTITTSTTNTITDENNEQSIDSINIDEDGSGCGGGIGDEDEDSKIEEYSNIFRKLKQENSFNEIINFTEREILVICDVCKHYFSDFKKNKFNNFDKLLLYLAFSKAGSSTTHISKMFNVTQVTISRVVQKIRLIIDQLSKKDLPFDIFRPKFNTPTTTTTSTTTSTTMDISNTNLSKIINKNQYHIGLIIDFITIKTTIADSKKKEYFDPINNIYGIKFMVAVQFSEPHYAIFVSPPYLGSTLDITIFNQQKHNLVNYLKKKPNSQEMDPTGKYKEWAVLTLFDNSTGSSLPFSNYYNNNNNVVEIIISNSGSNNLVVTDSTTTTTPSNNNNDSSSSSDNNNKNVDIRVVNVNENKKEFDGCRAIIDKYFGRLFGAWGIAGNYRLDQRFIEIDFRNLLWLTNIHIQKKDLDQDDLTFFYQFKKTLFESDKRIVKSRKKEKLRGANPNKRCNIGVGSGNGRKKNNINSINNNNNNNYNNNSINNNYNNNNNNNNNTNNNSTIGNNNNNNRMNDESMDDDDDEDDFIDNLDDYETFENSENELIFDGGSGEDDYHQRNNNNKKQKKSLSS